MQEFLEKIKPKQKRIFSLLRSEIVALPETQESLEIDEASGDWCPAYRVRGTDLAWIHLIERVWVHIPIEPSLEKKVIQDENLDSDLIERVKDTEEADGVKVAKLDVRSEDGVEQLMSLIRLKHAALLA